MTKFYIKVAIYFVCFLICLFALNAIDFNRFVKKGKIAQAQTLYVILAMVLGYLLANFFMAVIYYFYI